MLKQKRKWEIKAPTIVGAVIIIALILFYIYYIRTGQAHHFFWRIRSLGAFGMGIGVLFLAVLDIIPVPAEFVSIFLFEIYGVWQGFLLSILAGVIGAIAALYLSRWMARPFVEKMASKHLDKVNKVDKWIQRRGTFGLLAIRFLPLVPYHLVNYICGILHVRLLPFTWTTLLGIIPYHLALAGMFAGFRYGSLKWGVIGGGIFLVLVVSGFLMRKRFER